MNFNKVYKRYSIKNYSGVSSDLIELDQSKIDDLHKVLLPMIDDVMEFCKDRGLVCFLSGGTALGAVRHQGFIPWDDDVDLNMTRESYIRFVPEFRNQFSDKYWVHTPEDNPEFGISICRVRKKGTIVKTKDDIIDDSEAGAYIDIFIVENVYDNPVMRSIQGGLALVSKICLTSRKLYRDREELKKAFGYDGKQQKELRNRFIIGFLCSFMSVDSWDRLVNKIYSMCKNDNSKFVSIPAGRWHFFGEIYERKSFCATTSLPFEGKERSVCSNMDEYMTKLYGANYMQLPPVEARETHVCWAFNLGEEIDREPNL